MKILACHNRYLQTGGEDLSFDDEVDLLRRRGHEVEVYERHNEEISEMSSLGLSRKLFWNRRTYNDLDQRIQQFRPDVMHCTNTFPLISISAYDAASKYQVPVVQAFRNYRLFCANSVCVLNGKACERCLSSRFAWAAVKNRCYRDSHAASLAVALMQKYWSIKRPWDNKITLMYTLTEFARNKLIEFGLPANKVLVKPNFVPKPPTVGTGAGGYAVFVGRLSHEKGIRTLLKAWKELATPLKLIIMGDGPQNSEVEKACAEDARIIWKGRCDKDTVFQTIADASMLIIPSIAYETFGRTIIEAYAVGTPVIGSNNGAIAEVVVDGVTGLLFETGNHTQLAEKVNFLSESDEIRAAMRGKAYERFQQNYTESQNYIKLLSIYELAIARMAGQSDRETISEVRPAFNSPESE